MCILIVIQCVGCAGIGVICAYLCWKVYDYLYRLPKPEALVFPPNTLTIGHRGCRGDGKPYENTMASFQYALDHGADGFELDVRLTEDGKLIVFHDGSLMRCCNMEGFVSQYTYAKLKDRLTESSESIPLLEEAVLLAKKHSKYVLIEVKELDKPKEIADKIVELLRRVDYIERALIISFDPRSLYYVREKDPKLRTCYLYCRGLFRYYVDHNLELLPLWMFWIPAAVDALDWALFYGGECSDLLPRFLGARYKSSLAQFNSVLLSKIFSPACISSQLRGASQHRRAQMAGGQHEGSGHWHLHLDRQ
jgi:glycerophosphoryl diester phosphodiesterase